MWNGSENQITIVLIRHGATQSNKDHRYLGRTDESLSEEGKYDLLERKEAGCYPQLSCLFSSPMKRCVETTAILYPELHPVVISEWCEMDFGAFEGKNYVELKDDRYYQKWIDSNGILPFPEGESREAFILRCEQGFQKMLEYLIDIKAREQSIFDKVGMVVHGGTIMALLSRYCGGDYFDYQISTGGVYEWKFCL